MHDLYIDVASVPTVALYCDTETWEWAIDTDAQYYPLDRRMVACNTFGVVFREDSVHLTEAQAVRMLNSLRDVWPRFCKSLCDAAQAGGMAPDMATLDFYSRPRHHMSLSVQEPAGIIGTTYSNTIAFDLSTNMWHSKLVQSIDCRWPEFQCTNPNRMLVLDNVTIESMVAGLLSTYVCLNGPAGSVWTYHQVNS